MFLPLLLLLFAVALGENTDNSPSEQVFDHSPELEVEGVIPFWSFQDTFFDLLNVIRNKEYIRFLVLCQFELIDVVNEHVNNQFLELIFPNVRNQIGSDKLLILAESAIQ